MTTNEEVPGNAISLSFGTKKRRPHLRSKRVLEEEEKETADQDSAISVKELLETQKLRKRPHGISIEDLATAPGGGKERAPVVDPELAKMHTGGMVSLRTARAMAALPSLESGGQHIDIGTEFSAETQRRDEDYDMMKFIEEEVTKRKLSSVITDQSSGSVEPRVISRPEDALLVVAEQYQRDPSKKSEEMLSHQMLSGIPEVDLGIEAKIKNIEATEEAKRRLMQKYRESSPDMRQTPKSTASNSAVDYVQHARYNLDNYRESKDAKPEQVPPSRPATGLTNPGQPNAALSVPSAGELTGSAKPTDGVYFDRFKKNFKDKVERDKKSRRGK